MTKKLRALALAALMMMSSATAAARDDGTIRVYLASLGKKQELTVATAGDYLLDNAVLSAGSTLTIRAEDGTVWLASGETLLNLGKTALLRRVDGGLYIGESRLYRGDLTISAEKDRLVPVLSIDIEEYLLGVVGFEMSDTFPLEALKAQAVAARTYALKRRSERADTPWDVKDTAADQVFKGYEPTFANVAAAVEATRGVAGTVDGGFASCYFTASNGGQIARPRDIWGGSDDGAIELRDDPYDVQNPRSLVNALTFADDLSDCAALRALLSDGDEPLRVTAVTPIDPAFEGSLQYLGIEFALETAGGSKTARLSVYDDIKRGLSLGLSRSDCELISVTRGDGTFTLSMRRYGHGVGMSQRGAQWMAAEYGMTWKEILSYYYPNMALTALAFAEPERPKLPSAAKRLLPHREDAATVAASRLNLRSKPSTDAEILTCLSQGDRLKVEATENGWCRVVQNGVSGWCKEEYIIR